MEINTTSPYGWWAAANPECVAKAAVTVDIQIFQLCWCIICACQAFFFAIRYPKVTWEFVLVPLTEAVIYGLGYSGIGYVVLQSGRTVAWMRICHWLITVPVLLLQISDVAHVRFHGVNLSSLQVPISVLMIVFGFCAEVADEEGVKWMFFVIGLVLMFQVLFVGYHSLSRGITRFSEAGTEEGAMVANRLRAMLVFFLLSWTLHPLFFVLSIEGACVMTEPVTVVLYIVLDLFAKNIFQIVLWDSLWVRLTGKWKVEELVVHDASAELGYDEDYKHDEINLSIGNVPVSTESPVPRGAGEGATRPQSAIAMRNRMSYPVAGEHPASEFEQGLPPTYPGMGSGADFDLEMSPRVMQSRYSGYTAPEYEVAYSQRGGAVRTPLQTPGQQRAQGGGGRSARKGTQSMDEVVDHVKLLNQALSDLLVTDSSGKVVSQRPVQI
ncbi:hypothetical protein T484DRAFT_1960680 [Baffinella frigidus]|nr:hypothetical protein T484DRAFT_1960680 [Cryptophyta sp. CCMP2293]|mmetsp:Transcript_57240/g.136019  ORF Transcript_57240/g.136019 Transcript_57240/m.136019 type:complete len:439 (-) Transcript_57240:359-1675(-)